MQTDGTSKSRHSRVDDDPQADAGGSQSQRGDLLSFKVQSDHLVVRKLPVAEDAWRDL